MMSIIRRFLIKQKKLMALQEVRTDLNYLRKFKQHILSFDEEEARRELNAESKKEKPDEKIMATLSEQITESKATKKSFEDELKLEKDLSDYIATL